jgi:hypothetical protein
MVVLPAGSYQLLYFQSMEKFMGDARAPPTGAVLEIEMIMVGVPLRRISVKTEF